MSSYKEVIHTAQPHVIHEQALTYTEQLIEELSLWAKNIPENLTTKYTSINHAIDELTALKTRLNSIHKLPFPNAEVPYTLQHKTRPSKPLSRQVRYNNIRARLTALDNFYKATNIKMPQLKTTHITIPGAWS